MGEIHMQLPLAEDKLRREQFLSDLFSFFETFGDRDGHGLTMVLNGKFGSGKSTLLGFIQEHNSQENKYNILNYDAWENNYFSDPLLPILHAISKVENANSKIKEKAKEVIGNIPKAVLSTLANAHLVDLQPLFDNENIFDEFDNYKNAIIRFKTALGEFCASKKTILLVDELDRCLPEYQIKVLESIYHLLDIPNLIVVIALDKHQLETAIQAQFGTSTNCHGYLSKFIQYEVDLPEGDAETYLLSLIKFAKNDYYNSGGKKFVDILKSVELPLRESILLVEKLNLLFNNRPETPYFYSIVTGIVLLCKLLDNGIYQSYFTARRNYISVDTKLTIEETLFWQFFQDVKNREFGKVFNLLMNGESYEQGLLLYLIDLFYPIEKIELNSLSEFLGCEPDVLARRLNSRYFYNYPDYANQIIDNVKRLI